MIEWHRPAHTLVLMDRGEPQTRPDGHKSAPVDLSKMVTVHEGCATRGSVKEVSQVLSQTMIREGLARMGGEEGVGRDPPKPSSTTEEESERGDDEGDSTDFDELDRVERWANPIPVTDFSPTGSTAKIRVTWVDALGQIYGHAEEDKYYLFVYTSSV